MEQSERAGDHLARRSSIVGTALEASVRGTKNCQSWRESTGLDVQDRQIAPPIRPHKGRGQPRNIAPPIRPRKGRDSHAMLGMTTQRDQAAETTTTV